MATVAPAPIPTPPDFPVVWEQPDDERLFWIQDRMHFPDPLPTLDGQFTRLIYEGFSKAAEKYEMPVRGRGCYINTYHFSSLPPVMLPPEELGVLEKRSEEKLGAAMAELDRLWSEEYLPEIQRYIDDWASFDLAGASTSQLISHVDETMERFHRLWEIHFLVIFPTMLAISLFDEFYRELFDDAGTFDAYKLLQGFENKTVETGQALWTLSRRAMATPVVLNVLQEQEVSDVVSALQNSEEGRQFLAELDAYLKMYGQRSDALGLSRPGWIEDPSPVITLLKDYAAQPERDLDAEHAALVAEREQMVAEARERLAHYPAPVRTQFEMLLQAGQIGNVLSEDHDFYIDFTSVYLIRQVVLECGRRLADRGVIEQRDDVFHLTFEEMRESIEHGDQADRLDLVARRKAELEHFRGVQPPPVLGTQPPGPPPDNPGTRLNAKFWGVPPRESEDPDVLFGASGSDGVVQGPAKVVRSLAEADKLQPGDILVAATTIPSWTPLFGTAAAVVTDTGGILSHCAVVAREYGIPAVVGTGRATSVLSDGQIIEVDGNQGRVRIVHPG